MEAKTTANTLVKLLCFLYFCLSSECKNIDDIEGRLNILEQKFAILAYEHALTQQHLHETEDTLAEIENITEFLDIENRKFSKVENRQAKPSITNFLSGDKLLANMVRISSALLKAFQEEKHQRILMEGNINQLEKTHRLDQKKMELEIEQMKEYQGTFGLLTGKKIEINANEIGQVCAKLNTIDQSFYNFVNGETIQQIPRITSKLSVLEESVAAKTDVLAQVIEVNHKSVLVNLKEMSNHLLQKRVSFSARLSNNVIYLAEWTTLVFTDVITNVGNAYSAKTGTFIAPCDGIFVFFNHILGTSHMVEMWMQKNGNNVLYIEVNAVDADGNMVVLELKQGDKINVTNYHRAGSPPAYVQRLRTTFSGYMIYPLLNNSNLSN